jgi:hypothetical protein
MKILQRSLSPPDTIFFILVNLVFKVLGTSYVDIVEAEN